MADSNLKPWSQVCIKLLQGPLFRQNVNDKLWEKLEMYESDIQAFFAILGVSVAIDKADGFAFLQQNDLNEEDDNVSRLIRQIPLTEEQSFLCILLRDELNKFDNPNNSQNKSSILILSCSMVSLSRIVTQPSDSVSGSTVMQNGVPISS